MYTNAEILLSGYFPGVYISMKLKRKDNRNVTSQLCEGFLGNSTALISQLKIGMYCMALSLVFSLWMEKATVLDNM